MACCLVVKPIPLSSRNTGHLHAWAALVKRLWGLLLQSQHALSAPADGRAGHFFKESHELIFLIFFSSPISSSSLGPSASPKPHYVCHTCSGRSHLLELLFFHQNKLGVNWLWAIQSPCEPRSAGLLGERGDLLTSPYDSTQGSVGAAGDQLSPQTVPSCPPATVPARPWAFMALRLVSW